MSLVCLQASAGEALFQSPEVDVLWEAKAPLGPIDRSRSEQVARELGFFLKEDILRRVPEGIRSRGIPRAVVRFDDSIATSGGLFVPEDEEVPRLKGPLGAKTSSVSRRNRALSSKAPEIALYLHPSLLFSGVELKRIFAHEFFHGLHFVLHRDEPAWLREGLAQVFEALLMPKDQRFNFSNIERAFRSPFSVIVPRMEIPSGGSEKKDWRDLEQRAVSYGQTLLFFFYLQQRCGGESLFWALVESAPGFFGEDTVNRALSALGNKKPGCLDFSDAAREFHIARALNQIRWTSDDPKRWFILGMFESGAQKELPSAAEWSALPEWSAIQCVFEGATLPKHLGAGIWLRDEPSPEALEARVRPGPKYRRVLLIKQGSRKVSGSAPDRSSGATLNRN